VGLEGETLFKLKKLGIGGVPVGRSSGRETSGTLGIFSAVSLSFLRKPGVDGSSESKPLMEGSALTVAERESRGA
jgi:hypothetical protein